MADSSFTNFIDKKTRIHSMFPLIKILITILLIICIFLPCGFFGQVLLFITIMTIWFIAKIPGKFLKNIFITFVVIFIILFLINWIFFKAPGIDYIHPNSVIFDVGIKFNTAWDPTTNLPINDVQYAWAPAYGVETSPVFVFTTTDNETAYAAAIDYFKMHEFNKYEIIEIDNNRVLAVGYNAAWYGVSIKSFAYIGAISIKILLMLLIVTILISTTKQVQLNYGFEDLLYPLKAFKAPIVEWSMIISLSLRFVPSLVSEAKIILRAQASRGVDFSNGNIKDKVKSLVSLIVPMFSIAFKKAEDLANSMGARGFNPRLARSRYRQYNLNFTSISILTFVSLLFGFLMYFAIKHLIFGPFALIDGLY